MSKLGSRGEQERDAAGPPDRGQPQSHRAAAPQRTGMCQAPGGRFQGGDHRMKPPLPLSSPTLTMDMPATTAPNIARMGTSVTTMARREVRMCAA